MSRYIRIAGAGIAGLAAAINLAKNDFDVIIYEKGHDVGLRFSNDFQGLENWSTQDDILAILNNINIKTNFYYKAFNEANLIDPDMKKYIIKSRRIGVYMVQRGYSDGCLDQYLKNQALDLGVNFQFKSSVAEKDVDIVATGPKFASGMVYGLKGNIDEDNRVMFMLDDKSAFKGYSYLAIIDGKITLASVILKDFKNARNYLDHAVNAIRSIYKIEIRNMKPFRGIGNFSPLLNTYKVDNRLLIGERAGLQDYLFGFGMRYAFLSGYFAAQSLIHGTDYDHIIKNELGNKMKSSLVNRYLYEKLGNKGYRLLIKKWTSCSDPVEFLRKWYDYSWYKQLIYPFSLRWYGQKRRHLGN
jgi:flavin-dependent dehydrogenase